MGLDSIRIDHVRHVDANLIQEIIGRMVDRACQACKLRHFPAESRIIMDVRACEGKSRRKGKMDDMYVRT